MAPSRDYVSSEGNGTSPQADQYQVTEEAFGIARPLRIICIGAGATGINLVRSVKKYLKNVQLQIYEKNFEFGGTWFENRYPGCACDIPSHNYQYSWFPNPAWSEYYGSQEEIFQYFKDSARIAGAHSVTKLGHEVIGATWNDTEGLWHVQIKNLSDGSVFSDTSNFLINACGFLNNWKWPNITALHSFKGQLMHSASWDQGAVLDGKRVAVIGSGSSGIQIVAKIQSQVKHLTTFIRQPTWVTAGFGSKYAGENSSNFRYSEDQISTFQNNSQAYLEYRKAIEHELNGRFTMLHKDTPEQMAAREFSSNEMRRRLGSRSDLADFMIPQFSVGCRRPTPGQGYLEALTQPNITVITGTEISHVNESGIVMEDGRTVEVDVIICATGFDLSFCPRFPIVGHNGITMAEAWKDRPAAYLSMAPPGFPNYFVFLGPSAPVGHGSTIPIIEHITKYVLRMIYKAQIEGYKSFRPSESAVKEFIEHADELLKRTAWGDKCRSWFKNGKETGPVTALWPGSRIHWFHALTNPRFEDWEWKPVNPLNRWVYLGNGYSVKEGKNRDLAWYFDNPDAGYEAFEY